MVRDDNDNKYNDNDASVKVQILINLFIVCINNNYKNYLFIKLINFLKF